MPHQIKNGNVWNADMFYFHADKDFTYITSEELTKLQTFWLLSFNFISLILKYTASPCNHFGQISLYPNHCNVKIFGYNKHSFTTKRVVSFARYSLCVESSIRLNGISVYFLVSLILLCLVTPQNLRQTSPHIILRSHYVVDFLQCVIFTWRGDSTADSRAPNQANYKT